jgi:flavin reductase (DIM6/NTAB) family NADH-FMN oxidoreductase RutF|tara:strand:- start:377 stop:895 length:519 start_codon:yes stop_codon:yes gene_type:complete
MRFGGPHPQDRYHEQMSFDVREFRNAMGCFATGITVVTSRSASDEPLGVTVNSFSSVSLDPPLILFSLAHVGGHCQEFLASGYFAVNILTPDQRPLSDRFSMPRDNRFEGIAHDIGENGSPVFQDSLAVFECETFAVHEAGDHAVFICRVTKVHLGEEENALLFHRGQYHKL